MIIELFGPPGAGKTTFTRALCQELAERGITAKTVNGYRLIEYGEIIDEDLAGRHSIRRIFRKIATSGPILLTPLPRDSVEAQLLAKVPPRSRTWLWRMKVDIALLFEAWREAQRSQGCFIFEEGRLQSLSALLLLARTPDMDAVRDCLAILPRPDMLVQLDAPPEALHQRLVNRHARQSFLEVLLFEMNVDRSLKQADLSREIGECARQADWPLVRVNSADPKDVRNAIFGICESVANQRFDSSTANGSFGSKPQHIGSAVGSPGPTGPLLTRE